MMSMLRLASAFCLSTLVVTPEGALHAQEVPAKPVVAAIDRARALLDNGEGAGARTVLDSLVAILPNASIDLAEALYWRAAMSESIGEAERDWKRLLVEAPLSSRASDALLRLSELEALRGNSEGSRQHAERLVTEHAVSPNKSRALLLIAKGWFAENNARNACVALTELRSISASATGEIKLQSDELQPRCATVLRSAGGATPVAPVTPAKSPANTSTAASTANSKAVDAKTSADADARSGGQYSVQLAAYDRASDAEAMVRQLAAMNITARVEGSKAPFRVRTGRYATRAAAAEALKDLIRRGLKGFVAEPVS